MDRTPLDAAHDAFLAAARSATFGPPPPGEWTAEQLLAHVAVANYSIASTALAALAGGPVAYDNRTTLDRWYLNRFAARAGSLSTLIDQVADSGRLLCHVVEQLPDDIADLTVPTLIISNDEIALDEPIPLRALVGGVGEMHLPLHAGQLAALAATPTRA
jgi:DinB superfamily